MLSSKFQPVSTVHLKLEGSGPVFGQWITWTDQDMPGRRTEHGREVSLGSYLESERLICQRYSYDSCEVGTLPNQTWVNGTGPIAAFTTGPNGGTLSYLPGQRISACTCPGKDHPGLDFTVGQAAPEIDMVEAQIAIAEGEGQVSAARQLAPFDDYYQFDNSTRYATIYDKDLTYDNTYLGSTTQQSASGLITVPSNIYYDQNGESKQFTMFAIEYLVFPDDRDNAYITWWADNKTSWTLHSGGMGPNERTEISRRLIPEEPMTMVRAFRSVATRTHTDIHNLKVMNLHTYGTLIHTKVHMAGADILCSRITSRLSTLITSPGHTIFESIMFESTRKPTISLLLATLKVGNNNFYETKFGIDVHPS